MRYCTNCGHRLQVGRYCTNCGARVPSTIDTARRRAGADAPPPSPSAPPSAPPLGPEPSSARYPLQADTEPATAAHDAVPAPTARSRGPWLLVALLGLALVVLVGGAVLLLLPSDDPDGAGAADQTEQAGPQDEGDDGSTAGGSAGGGSALVPADIAVPGTAPASVDDNGDPVTFAPSHLLDADPRTSWRMPGDGTGSVVTFTFDQPVTVTEVGLVNGYAKTDGPHDWYAGNRRITAVAWGFDDGTEVTQDLAEERSLQRVPVPAVETTSVVLRILEVTEPGAGPDGRDFTAISEVELTGRTS